MNFDATAVSDPVPVTADGARELPGGPGQGRSRLRAVALIVVLFLVGLLARSVAVDGSDSFLVRWLPWMQRDSVTFYYADPQRPVLVPVSRTLDRDATLEDFLGEYLAGPRDGSGLSPLIPTSTSVAGADLIGGVLRVELNGNPDDFSSPLVREGLHRTLSGWKGAETVRATVDGLDLELEGSVGHLLFFYDAARDMLVAEPTEFDAPRDVLAAFLGGTTTDGLAALPPDVQLISFDFDVERELLRLDFTFTPAVEALALDHPQSMRRVLEGLIATMTTGFPQFSGLYLDFEGRATLGLGQCADLLRNLQVTPAVLNDERLLARSGP